MSKDLKCNAEVRGCNICLSYQCVLCVVRCTHGECTGLVRKFILLLELQLRVAYLHIRYFGWDKGIYIQYQAHPVRWIEVRDCILCATMLETQCLMHNMCSLTIFWLI